MPRRPTPLDLGRSLGTKSVQLRVRVSEAENEQLHRAMAHVGYSSISDFVRWALLEAAERVMYAPSAASYVEAQQAAYNAVGGLPPPPVEVAPVPTPAWAPVAAGGALLGIPLRGGDPVPLSVDDTDGWT